MTRNIALPLKSTLSPSPVLTRESLDAAFENLASDIGQRIEDHRRYFEHCEEMSRDKLILTLHDVQDVLSIIGTPSCPTTLATMQILMHKIGGTLHEVIRHLEMETT